MERRILIVDDHAGFRRSAARSLVAAGWNVVGEAEDGTAALEAAERCNPDVVLLDVGLPDISGIEVARLLHERAPGRRRGDDLDPGPLRLRRSGAGQRRPRFPDQAGSFEQSAGGTRRVLGSMAVRIEQTVARAVSSAADVGDAYTRALEAIGTDLDWNLAAAWEPNAGGERLRCAALWSRQGDGDEFAEVTRSTTLRARRGAARARSGSRGRRSGSPTPPATSACRAGPPPRSPGCTPRSGSRCAASAASSA